MCSTAERWAQTRTFHHSAYTAAADRGGADGPISVCLPARGVRRRSERSSARCCRCATPGRSTRSSSSTPALATAPPRSRGRRARRCYQEDELLPGVRCRAGQGRRDVACAERLAGRATCASWTPTPRASPPPTSRPACLGPLVSEPGVRVRQGLLPATLRAGWACRCPRAGAASTTSGASRARALLSRAGRRAPAARGGGRGATGATGEAALHDRLRGRDSDAAGRLEEVGGEGVAQVDLEVHRNRHQPLDALAPMARTVLATIALRLEREGR